MADLTSLLLDGAGFEVIPLKGALEKAMLLPEGSVISVTALPAKGIEATVDLTMELREHGYTAVPHLSARMIKDRSELAGILKRLADSGIEQVFVVGGDAEEPGDFDDAFSLIREMSDIGHPFTRLGITGYPQGHPFISEEKLLQALIDKQPFATYISTQMCFSARTIALWASRIRAEGISLPIKVGIPGVIDPTKLLNIAARIGVGTSTQFLAKNRQSVFRLLRPGSYHPNRLVRDLAKHGEGLDLEGLHIFTFNQVAPTLEWYQRVRAAA